MTKIVSSRTGLTLSALAIAALLAACGGGGGGSSGTVTPPPSSGGGGGGTVTPPPDPYALQTEVAAPTYAAGSWQEFAFNYLNERRGQCGFGKLAHAPELDKSAQAHADYLARLFKDTGNAAFQTDIHQEDASRPLFTGVWPWDRAKAAGYAGYGVEQIAFTGYEMARPDMDALRSITHNSIQGLLSGPYHLNLMISSTRDVGFGLNMVTVQDDPDYGASAGFFVMNPGQKIYPQVNLTQTLSYPCEGTTNVEEGLYGETPNPTNGQSPVKLPTGPAIMLVSRMGSTLNVQTASVPPMSRLDGQPLGDLPSFNYAASYPSGILMLNRSTDKNGYLGEPEKAFLLTHKPLAMGVTYRVEVSYTVSGQAQTKSFQFSTRTQLPKDRP